MTGEHQADDIDLYPTRTRIRRLGRIAPTVVGWRVAAAHGLTPAVWDGPGGAGSRMEATLRLWGITPDEARTLVEEARP